MNKEVLVIGFALFAMFFGAGNLIFPPSLGVATGTSWLVAGLGFLITAVSLPLLGVLAFAKAGDLKHFADKVSPKFNIIFCTVLTLVIGPFFAIPRTASTTFELGILPIIGKSSSLMPAIITSVIFFTLSYFLALKESKITDIIGKYLTPVILIILVIIGIIGFNSDIGEAVDSKVAGNLFGYGFVNGYQTMDALASILFGVVILKDLVSKGIVDKKEQSKYIQKAGLIAVLGLGLVYIVLIFLGSKISHMEFSSTTAAAVYLAKATLGEGGSAIFGLCVALACLTTSIGVTAFVADWLEQIVPISYQKLVLIISVFSAIVSVGGVDLIVTAAVPMLLLLYPITIVLILLNVFGVQNVLCFRLSAYVVLIISLIEVAGSTFKIGSLSSIIQAIPLGSAGFAWVLPFILSVLIALVFYKKKGLT